MMRENLQQTETHLLEVLLSSLDARESARAAGAPMLLYLTEMLVQRAREDLETVRTSLETNVDESQRHI